MLLLANILGYYVVNFRAIAGQQDILAELWKEYALSDSRYLTGDSLILTLEAIAVVRMPPLIETRN
jgi:cholestenol Delta-isomerase